MSPTKRGLGVEVWGAYDDISAFYDVACKFSYDQSYHHFKGYENRSTLLSGFTYELRKAKEESRLIRKLEHPACEDNVVLGTQFSWVHMLFSLVAIKENTALHPIDKYDRSVLLQVEYWVETAIEKYDPIGAERLKIFINGGLYSKNPYLYQFMRSINLEYFQLCGGKRAFRKLPDLLKKGVLWTKEYKEFFEFLEYSAKQNNCEIDALDLDDEDVDYENIKW